jgi:hypothetical protein
MFTRGIVKYLLLLLSLPNDALQKPRVVAWIFACQHTDNLKWYRLEVCQSKGLKYFKLC